MQTEEEIPEGVLYPLYSVKCGFMGVDCVEREDTFECEMKEAKKLLRSDGWVQTRNNGWVCPKCYPEYKKA